MHIPDNFLNAPTLLTTSITFAEFLSYALKKCRATMEEKNIPLLGITGAFIFATQMLNFPVLMDTYTRTVKSYYGCIISPLL
ncbi:MAG: energy-coupling factor ABC transporter permease [Bacillota bacterium]|uniref:energy-coupling factor ABC transporter permease n=1 Tax=Thermanaerosceptrum fracticalcis TaxID=1712410 RepID=UPI000554D366